MSLRQAGRWLHANRARLAVSILFFYFSYSYLLDIPYNFKNNMGLNLIGPWLTAFNILVFSATSIFVVGAGWLCAEILPIVATALGYSEKQSYQINVHGQGNVVSVPTTSSSEAKTEDIFTKILTDQYEAEQILSPIRSARFRLLDHIGKLRNNSVTNLFMGIGIAIVGVGVLSSSIFQVSQFYDNQNHVLDEKGFLFFAVLPKLSVTLFVQVFSFFFLAMYRSNQTDIRYFQNEITLLDSMATAVIGAQLPGNMPHLKPVLNALCKNERNRVMKKGEKSIISSDEAEFMRALSLIASLKPHTFETPSEE